MAKLDINNFKFTAVQEFFFDTSVWLLLYGNVGNFKKADQKFYASAFQEIVEKRATIIVTSQVLSEITNVLLRKGAKDFAVTQGRDPRDLQFKTQFVGTNDYYTTVHFVETILNEILGLQNIVRIGDSFSDIDISKILKDLQLVDYNDSYYVELLKKRNQRTILVTNDGDFLKISKGIDIYTNRS